MLDSYGTATRVREGLNGCAGPGPAIALVPPRSLDEVTAPVWVDPRPPTTAPTAPRLTRAPDPHPNGFGHDGTPSRQRDQPDLETRTKADSRRSHGVASLG